MLTVDVATWNSYFWNNSLIATTAVDRVITMETYCCEGNLTQWQQYLDAAVRSTPRVQKLAVGLITGNVPLSKKQLSERISLIAAAKIAEIDVWDVPVPTTYYDALRQWIST